MRLSNKNKIGLYNFVNTFLILIVLACIGFFLLERYRFHILGWESYIFLLIPLLVAFTYYNAGRQIFEYDSDGEALNFKNRSTVPFMKKNASDEFPKYKLIKYEIINFIFFKRLYITISSKKNLHQIVLKYDISYLGKKEISDLRHSLNKVIKTNKENNVHNS